MNTTKMTAQQVQEIATEIAKENAFDYAGNFGRGTFRFEVRTHLTGDTLTLSAVVNACVRIERARIELHKVWLALDAKLKANGAEFCRMKKKTNGVTHFVWRQGDWHMGHFHTSGLARQIKVK